MYCLCDMFENISKVNTYLILFSCVLICSSNSKQARKFRVISFKEM